MIGPPDRTGPAPFAAGVDTDAVLCLAPDVEVVDQPTRWGTSYTMIENPRGRLYFRLSEANGRLVRLMDGTRSVRDLASTELGTVGTLDIGPVVDLVDLLSRNGFMAVPFVDAYALIRSRTTERETRFGRAMRRLFKTQTVHLPGAERLSDLLYRLGGRFLFTWPAQVTFVALLLLGPIAFVEAGRSRGFHFEGYGLAQGVLLLFALDMVATAVHEAGHALAIRHAGRRVLSAGFQLYLGHPAFFIDSSDVLMASRRDRVRNAWYGPYMSLVVAGTAALAAYFAPAGSGRLLFQLAALTYLAALINLIPFLELDGYWMLTDLLDMPDLRPRSLTFMARELPGRIRHRHRLTRQEWGLVTFGVVGAIFTVVSLWTSWLILQPVFSRFIRAMWDGGPLSRVLLLALGALIFGPLVHGIAKVGRSAWGNVRFTVRRLGFLAERGWRAEAGEMIDQLPLLSRIPIEDLNLVAGGVSLRRYASGQAVVRQGDAGDAFYVVRRGRLAVIRSDPSGSERALGHLSPGEAFGELALLQGQPRAATVRAIEVAECFVIGKSLFERHLARSMRAPEVSTLVEAWSLPPFRHLSEDEALALLEAGSWLNAVAGQMLIEQGAAPDAFYVLESGRTEVIVDGVTVATLGAGDHFGEVALLRDSPRTASVRALTPARLFRLDHAGFDRLVADAGRRENLSRLYDAPASRD